MSFEIDIDLRQGDFQLSAAFRSGARITALMGRSGSGKTTLVNAIAGLVRPQRGRIVVDGIILLDLAQGICVPAHRRRVGYVFQEGRLFPHLTVKQNLMFGRWFAPRREAGAEPDHITDLLGIGHLLARRPATLSGGEKQRVAIARALLANPRILLMDEPLAALDRAAKDEILPVLERLHRELAIPVIYVTHDMAEVERLADHLVLMAGGRVLAYGPPGGLQADPALPLIRAREAAVGLDGRVEGYDVAYGLARLGVAGGVFLVPAPPLAAGDIRRLRIFAGDVSLSREKPGPSSILNVLCARIHSAVATTPHEMTCVLGLGEAGQGARLLARVTRMSWDRLALAEGAAVFAQVKAVALVRAGRN